MAAVSDQPQGRARLALASRNDPLTPYLHAALGRRYPITAEVGVELSGLRRAAIAATTVRPGWGDWAESYMKSNLGFRTRSRLAQRKLAAASDAFDLVIQTHALFSTRDDRTIVYVDCTYRQALAGWPAWTPHRSGARRRWLAAETETYRRALHLFAFTSATRNSLVEGYGIDASRVSVVGAGVNFRRAPEPEARSEAGDPTVLFVGKDFVRKGGEVLLQAFGQVRRAIPRARLQIVGTNVPGPAPDGVEVLGVVSDRERVAELYRRADVFCLPSLFDPSPLVVLEAMAYALPCVLSRDASHHVRDVMAGGAGHVVDTGDAEGLAEGLIMYLRDRELAAQTGERGRRAAATGFRWSDVVTRMAPAIDAAAELVSAVS